MRPRDLFHWKTYFYGGLLPLLRRLGPGRADAVLAGLGWARAALWPPYRRWLAAALERGRAAAGATRESAPATAAGLAAGSLRFIARDYLLDTMDDGAALGRFDVTGGDAVVGPVAGGTGRILVGAHLGGHLSALHWLYRNGLPLRVMVQRPGHVSGVLGGFFDRPGPLPQAEFFLRRGLGPADCVERLLRVRAALQSGTSVYFAGDIPWTGPNTRPGRLLGRPHKFLSVWADLSVLTGAPVVFVFCTHRPGGRFDLRFEPVGPLTRGAEDAAVAHFLGRLEATIAARPCDAVAHLLWPCYCPSAGADAAGPLPAHRGTSQVPARRSWRLRAGLIRARTG